jgi:hypothetical protein
VSSLRSWTAVALLSRLFTHPILPQHSFFGRCVTALEVSHKDSSRSISTSAHSLLPHCLSHVTDQFQRQTSLAHTPSTSRTSAPSNHSAASFATQGSSTRAGPSTHRLNAATLAIHNAIPYQADEQERISRIQRAARELGFELPYEWLQRDAQELEQWLAAQSQNYISRPGTGHHGSGQAS